MRLFSCQVFKAFLSSLFPSQRRYRYCAITQFMGRSIAPCYFDIFNVQSRTDLLPSFLNSAVVARTGSMPSIHRSIFLCLSNTLRQLCAKWDRSINLWARIAANSASIEAATTCGKCTIAAGSALGPGGSKRIRLQQRAQDNGRAKIKRDEEGKENGKAMRQMQPRTTMSC